jgi:hypothetical protein
MHVRFDAADLVDVNARRFDAALLQLLMGYGFDRAGEERGAVLRVPGQVRQISE